MIFAYFFTLEKRSQINHSHQNFSVENIFFLIQQVIEENPNHAKAYFRRGESLVALNEHELAKIDFHKVLDLDPENKAAKNKVLEYLVLFIKKMILIFINILNIF